MGTSATTTSSWITYVEADRLEDRVRVDWKTPAVGETLTAKRMCVKSWRGMVGLCNVIEPGVKVNTEAYEIILCVCAFVYPNLIGIKWMAN
jgi:hypothetical protein